MTTTTRTKDEDRDAGCGSGEDRSRSKGWIRFLSEARQFESVSRELGDGWILQTFEASVNSVGVSVYEEQRLFTES